MLSEKGLFPQKSDPVDSRTLSNLPSSLQSPYPEYAATNQLSVDTILNMILNISQTTTIKFGAASILKLRVSYVSQ